MHRDHGSTDSHTNGSADSHTDSHTDSHADSDTDGHTHGSTHGEPDGEPDTKPNTGGWIVRCRLHRRFLLCRGPNARQVRALRCGPVQYVSQRLRGRGQQ